MSAASHSAYPSSHRRLKSLGLALRKNLRDSHYMRDVFPQRTARIQPCAAAFEVLALSVGRENLISVAEDMPHTHEHVSRDRWNQSITSFLGCICL